MTYAGGAGASPENDTIDVKAPSKAEVAAAEGARAAAHLGALRREIRERCEEPFALEDEILSDGDETTDVVVRRARAEARSKERMLILCETFKSLVVNAEAAGAAADTIISVEDECEREERVLQALLERCKRRAEWTRFMLWGALEAYKATTPRSKNKKGEESKSWRFPWTTARLTNVDAEAKVEVVDRTRCLAWIKGVIGLDRAIDLDILKVEEAVRVGPLRDWALTGLRPGIRMDGVEFTPAGERLTLYRK